VQRKALNTFYSPINLLCRPHQSYGGIRSGSVKRMRKSNLRVKGQIAPRC
jgi:hypothetical protein